MQANTIGLVSPTQSNSGDTIEAADINDPVNQLAAVINGNIETANIADSAVTTAKIANASVTNAKLSTTAGEVGGAWLTWTPTWTNVSGGSTNYAKYTIIGKTVHFRIKYTLAGAGVSGAVTFSTPQTMNADYALETPIAGTANFLDSGTQLYPAHMIAGSTTTIILRPVNASATNATAAANTSSTNPINPWASGDEIKASGSFEMA